MKNADRLFNECLEELKGIDLEPDKHVILKVKSLANAYGYCKPFDDHYIIEIDRKLFSDNLPDDICKSIIIHELLHAEKGCTNHGAKWLEKVRKQESALGYTVSGGETTGDYRPLGWTRFGVVPENTKFIVRCKYCGRIRIFNKECRAMKDLIAGFTACPGCAERGVKTYGYELLSDEEVKKWKDGTYYNEMKCVRNYFKDCSDAEIRRMAETLCPSSSLYNTYTGAFLAGDHAEYRNILETILRDGYNVNGYRLFHISNDGVYTFVKGNEHFVICLPEYFGTEYSVITQRIDGIDYLIASPTIEAAVNMIELFRKPEMPR